MPSWNLFHPDLTPAQRAQVQALITVLTGAVIAGISAASDYLARNASIDYQRLALIVGLTVAYTCIQAFIIYLMAHDIAMGLAIEALFQQAEKRLSSLIPPEPVVLPSIQQNAPTTPQDAQQTPLASIPVSLSVQPQNAFTTPIQASAIRMSKVTLVPIPGDIADMPTTLTEVPLQGDVRATASLTPTQPRIPAVQGN